MPLGYLGQGTGAVAVGTAFELISTTILGADTASVSFSSIVSTYQHLQLRIVARNADNFQAGVQVIFNNDTTYGNYQYRFFRTEYGGGSITNSAGSGSDAAIMLKNALADSGETNYFSPLIIDIADYANTNKKRTARAFAGYVSNQVSGYRAVNFNSGTWNATTALTTLTVKPENIDGSPMWKTGSRFSLYGIKGA